MFTTKCLRRPSDSCAPSRTERYAPLHQRIPQNLLIDCPSRGPVTWPARFAICPLHITIARRHALACLNQNCSNYGDNYDDAQKQVVPNSQSDYATSDGSGLESEFDCHVTKFQFSYNVTCRLSVLQAVLVYWSAGFCQIYSLKCYSRNYSEICAKFMQILRQMLHFLQFLCMQIDACHLSKGIITSPFISLNIIYFGLCFQHLRTCPALYFVMDPYFGTWMSSRWG